MLDDVAAARHSRKTGGKLISPLFLFYSFLGSFLKKGATKLFLLLMYAAAHTFTEF
jgi:hypothetical protein